ncbi:MAG TPA: hypothetical protein VNJ02_19190 [Vicinamibacterales bacterium]|nr:hypothetical protein [Vicinamibacterales bacterium]
MLKPFDRKALLAAVEQGVAWHSDAGSTSARSEETADGLMAWLERIDGTMQEAQAADTPTPRSPADPAD